MRLRSALRTVFIERRVPYRIAVRWMRWQEWLETESLFARIKLRFTFGALRERGLAFARRWRAAPALESRAPFVDARSRLHEFVNTRTTGRGIWKWSHYLDVYDRHCSHFVGRPVHVLEIGVYSGGSLDLWRHYFGAQCQITGVDIEPAVRAYESDGVQILVGDQGDPHFWQSVLPTLRRLDVVIDDGGHKPWQQITTLEALLPHMNPGGVYICEDIHREWHGFAAYISGLTAALHAEHSVADPETPSHVVTTPFQASVRAIHTYPYIAVIELNECPVPELIAPRIGTEWQPFYEPQHRERRGSADHHHASSEGGAGISAGKRR
jgi:methyltransferase family protein